MVGLLIITQVNIIKLAMYQNFHFMINIKIRINDFSLGVLDFSK